MGLMNVTLDNANDQPVLQIDPLKQTDIKTLDNDGRVVQDTVNNANGTMALTGQTFLDGQNNVVQSIDAKNQDLAGLIVRNLPTWLAWVFVAFIVIAEMSSNYLNVYTGALSALASGISMRRWLAALVFGLLGGVIAGAVVINADRFESIYLSFLTVTYVWFPAWCTVVLVDFWRRRTPIDFL